MKMIFPKMFLFPSYVSKRFLVSTKYFPPLVAPGLASAVTMSGENAREESMKIDMRTGSSIEKNIWETNIILSSIIYHGWLGTSSMMRATICVLHSKYY